MKVGIVTHPLLTNYGGILQNFALQQVLRKLGYDPITIDLVPDYSIYKYMCSLCKTLLLYFIPWKRRSFVSYRSKTRRNAAIESFCQKHIALTERVRRYRPDVVIHYGFQAVIVGSDQVWRARYNRYPGYMEDMFLNFVENPRVKKMAYAASFGIDEWDYTKETTERCRKLVQQFVGISVRERSGVALCDKFLHVKAIQVLDPTLLLKREDYEQLCAIVPKDTFRFMAVYLLDLSLPKRKMVEHFAHKRGLSVKCFSAHDNMKLTVEEWLAMFRDAEFVVTDSFHGTVFSIIFNKPFLSIGNPSRGMARFHSLLEMFGLKERLCEAGQEFFEKDKEIDWKKVNRKRKEWQEWSLEFLRRLK